MKSIMQGEKVCYITGRMDNLQKHHIYFGSCQREMSDKNGFWCYLTGVLHNQSEKGVHMRDGHELDQKLKQECQRKYEETNSREDFRRLVGKSYL